MPKISDLDYVSEIDATSYLLGVKGGATVRFPASILQGEAPVVNTTFISQGDTPTSYVGQTGKLVAVKSDSSGLEFVSATAGSYAIVDLSSATEDYALAPGEVAKITYSGVTSLPLRIATAEGVYEILFRSDCSATVSNNNVAYLTANASEYTNAYIRVGYYSLSTNTGGQGVSTESKFYSGAAGVVIKARMLLYTYTKSKAVEYSSIGKRMADVLNETGNIFWNDTTTVWSSLGTITFPFAQSGTVVIKRIA